MERAREGERSEIRRFLAQGALFLLPLALGYELACGGWLRDSSLDDLNLLRDVDRYVDVSRYYGPPGTMAHIKTDRYGFRGAYRDPGRIDVLTMGSSTTLQEQISEGETWQDVLHERLAKDGKDVTVVNAGVDAQTTTGYLKDFDLWFPQVPGLKPRFVLLYLGVDELLVVSREQAYKSEMNRLTATRTWSRRLRTKSAMYRVARGILLTWWGALFENLGNQRIELARAERTTEPLRGDLDKALAQPLSELAARLRRLAARIRELGAEPIYVLEPEGAYLRRGREVAGVAGPLEFGGQTYNGVDVYHAVRLLAGTVRAVSSEVGARFLDVGADADFDESDFYDYHHETPRGVRKVGEVMYDRLKDLF